jgi:hypothetical protein
MARRPGNAPVPRFVATAPPKSSLPAEFVVGGKGAGAVFDGNQISLAAAKKIARVCRDWAWQARCIDLPGGCFLQVTAEAVTHRYAGQRG